MPDIYVGETATFGFLVLDNTGPPGAAVTGLTGADFSWDLNRRTGAAAFASAPESMSIAERGGGWYEASFTVAADADGYFYAASILELVTVGNPNSLEVVHRFFALAGSEDEAFTEADAFCSLSDVQARVGRGAFSEVTIPTSGQVIDFMATRAAQIAAALRTAGYACSPASGSAPISTSDDDGKHIERTVRLANMLLAAGDAVFAFDVLNEADPARARGLWTEGTKVLEDAIAFCTNVIGTKPGVARSEFDHDYDPVTDLPFGVDTVF